MSTFGLGLLASVTTRKYLLTWVSLRWLSYGCNLYGVSVITFGLGLFVSVIRWLYSVWRKRECSRPGSHCVGYHMVVLCMASTNVPLAWVSFAGYHMALLCMASGQAPLACVSLRRSSYGCTLHSVNVSTFGLSLLASVIIWLHSA